MNFPVFALNLEGKKFQERGVEFEDGLTSFMRALHFLKGVYLVYGIVMEAGFAERIFVLTSAHENILFLSLFCS